MDIDFIRYLVREGSYRTTLEFERILAQRDVTLEQVRQAIYSGRIVREEKGRRGGFPKATIRGFIATDLEGSPVPLSIELEVACAVGEEVVLVTVY